MVGNYGGSTFMSESEELAPETCSKYVIEGNKVSYTKSGYKYYKALFAQAGINVDNICTVDDLKSAMKHFPIEIEIEFKIKYGESPDADLTHRHFSALLSENFDEAERLEAIIDRKQLLTVVEKPKSEQ